MTNRIDKRAVHLARCLRTMMQIASLGGTVHPDRVTQMIDRVLRGDPPARAEWRAAAQDAAQDARDNGLALGFGRCRSFDAASRAADSASAAASAFYRLDESDYYLAEVARSAAMAADVVARVGR